MYYLEYLFASTLQTRFKHFQDRIQKITPETISHN
uniref:Uncharacterized protein n=1 Tax=Arundo donax TaxID=35708 RepID=A0A0A8Y912_ARUDO